MERKETGQMHDYTKEDRKHRERLEAQSVPMARADRVASLNRLAAGDVLQRSAAAVLTGLRNSAQGRARVINDLNARHDAALAKGVAAEAFNRLHPLSRAAADFRPRPEQEPDSEGTDAAKDERYVSPLRAAKVPGAEGRIEGGGRHYEPKGEPSSIEPEFLTVEQMRVIAGVKALASRYF
jgi:hypothetical protein